MHCYSQTKVVCRRQLTKHMALFLYVTSITERPVATLTRPLQRSVRVVRASFYFIFSRKRPVNLNTDNVVRLLCKRILVLVVELELRKFGYTFFDYNVHSIEVF